MTASIHFSQPALTDLVDIVSYTASAWGEAQAEAYIAVLQSAIERAARQPKSAPLKRLQGRALRVLAVRRHLIFYREEAEGILVVRVLHASRDVQAALDTDDL
ncbi:MAG: type II toxin-antitoxin system RelE/ParE family toxin [Rhodospirillales bacterium]